MADLERRILEELVYERVRLNVNLCELLWLEQDLEASIERALEACARSTEEKKELTRRYMEGAWRRLEEEWRGAGEDADDEPEPCPLCEGA